MLFWNGFCILRVQDKLPEESSGCKSTTLIFNIALEIVIIMLTLWQGGSVPTNTSIGETSSWKILKLYLHLVWLMTISNQQSCQGSKKRILNCGSWWNGKNRKQEPDIIMLRLKYLCLILLDKIGFHHHRWQCIEATANSYWFRWSRSLSSPRW